jgi:hypothetical protein
MVLAAERAELFEFNTLGGRLLVFHARVILPLALAALKRDLFTWHFRYSSLKNPWRSVLYPVPPAGRPVVA